MDPYEESFIDKAVEIMKDNPDFKLIRVEIHPAGIVLIERHQVVDNPK